MDFVDGGTSNQMIVINYLVDIKHANRSLGNYSIDREAIVTTGAFLIDSRNAP